MNLIKYIRQDSEKRIVLFIGICTAVIHSTMLGYINISKVFILIMLFWFTLIFFKPVTNKGGN